MIASFAAGAAPKLALTFLPVSVKRQTDVADLQKLAAHIRNARLAGPVAGGGRGGMYLSYFLDQPWLGDQPDAPADLAWLKAHARIILVAPGDLLDQQLSRDQGLRDVTSLLRGSLNSASAWTFKVYQVADR